MIDLIYLDNSSTTKVDRRVYDAMEPFCLEDYGNPSSIHLMGNFAAFAVKEARSKVSRLIGCHEDEVVFTSGATESINLALKGFLLANRDRGNHVITVSTEHKAVLNTCRYLETIGYRVSYLPVLKDGSLDLNVLEAAIEINTALICVMLVNNETGVIHDLTRISKIAHAKGICVMCDGSQAVGKINVDVDLLGVDLLTFSSHKFYGPKGVGGLFIKKSIRRQSKLLPELLGGGQESGLRSGTLNVPGIVGLGKAAELSSMEIDIDTDKIIKFRNFLEVELLKLPDTFLNGGENNRSYNISNVCFSKFDATVMLGTMKNLAISNGSACDAQTIEPSHVLKAMGLTDDNAFSSLRFSFGRFNIMEDSNRAYDMVLSCLDRLR